jgi:hypothetical protein
MRNMGLLILVLLVATTGCSAKSTEPVLADSAFSGQALLDVNDNGKIDPQDTPIENATFYVELQGVKAFGDLTDKQDHAFIMVPGGVEYPVNVLMEAPKDSTFRIVGPSRISLSAATGTTHFLFSQSEMK